MNDIVMWMGDRKSRGATSAASSYGGPSREERSKKAEMWRSMLNGTYTPPSEASSSPTRVRKVKLGANQKSVASQVEVRKVRKDQKDQKGQTYWCCRCQGLLRGGERQALAHWVSKCMKGLGKLPPPEIPETGRFPPVQIVGNGRQCTVATQEKLPGVYESQRLIRKSDPNNSNIIDEQDEEFVVNYFAREPSAEGFMWGNDSDDDFTVHTVKNIKPTSPKKDKITNLHHNLIEADMQLDILTKQLTQSYHINPEAVELQAGSRTEKLLQLDRLIKNISAALTLQRIGRGFTSRIETIHFNQPEPLSPCEEEDETAIELLHLIRFNIETASTKVLQRCGSGFMSRRRLGGYLNLKRAVVVIEYHVKKYLHKIKNQKSSTTDVNLNTDPDPSVLPDIKTYLLSVRVPLLQSIGRGFLARKRCQLLYNSIPSLTDTLLSPLTCASPLSASGVQDFLLSTRVPFLQRVGRAYLSRISIDKVMSNQSSYSHVQHLLLLTRVPLLQRVGRSYTDRLTILSSSQKQSEDKKSTRKPRQIKKNKNLLKKKIQTHNSVRTLQRVGKGYLSRCQLISYEEMNETTPFESETVDDDDQLCETFMGTCEDSVNDLSTTEVLHHSTSPLLVEGCDAKIASPDDTVEDPTPPPAVTSTDVSLDNITACDPTITSVDINETVDDDDQLCETFMGTCEDSVNDLNAATLTDCKDLSVKTKLDKLSPIAMMCLFYIQKIGRGSAGRVLLQQQPRQLTVPTPAAVDKPTGSLLQGMLPTWVRTHITGAEQNKSPSPNPALVNARERNGVSLSRARIHHATVSVIS